MKTNEDFLEWMKEEERSLPLIAQMKPEHQPEYYLRKGYFANNDDLEHNKDLIYELGQNLLAAQDQNHYHVLLCEFRDKNFLLQEQLEKSKAETAEWKKGYDGLMDDLAATATELNEIKKVDLHSAHERIKDLNVYIKDLKKDLDWTTIGWNIETTVGSNVWELMKKIRVKYKLGE